MKEEVNKEKVQKISDDFIKLLSGECNLFEQNEIIRFIKDAILKHRNDRINTLDKEISYYKKSLE